MKHLLYPFILFFLSCSPNQKEDSYIVKYGPKEVHSAEFINTLMILGFTKHGKAFYSKVYDSSFFEQMRTETLEHIINKMFYSSLSQKYKIKITDAELEAWIKERTPDLAKEDLLYTLKANNFTYSDWKGLFRDQLIQSRIIQQLNEVTPTPPSKVKKSNDDAIYLAIISFEDQLEAKEQHKKIARNKVNFDDVLKRENQTRLYSWVRTKDLPFYDKIKYLPLRKSSKPIETSWGYALVRIQKRGKFPLPNKDVAEGQTSSSIKPLLEEFKKSPKLHINTELLYSLKIKK